MPFHVIGTKAIQISNDLGAAIIFFASAFMKIFRSKQIREIIQQVFFIGAKSSNIVMLIGLFTGMVLGLQLYYTLKKFGSEGFLGSVISLSLIRELGPVLTAIMITARAGSAMTAEIGILRISEQIDALYTMRIDPIRYLISPRIAAAIISFPLLTAFFDLIGILGGYAYVLPDNVRTRFSNAYDNLKAPARMINNLLQLRLKQAGTELVRFLVNSTIGIGGFDDIANDVLDIKKQEAEFGQTLGHYGVGHGIYIVWPVLGPSSLRETVGFVGDRFMYPLTYISNSDLPIEATVGIAAHEKVNDSSFKIGDYESFINAVVDPYIAMRDSFLQYRRKKIEESEPLFMQK